MFLPWVVEPFRKAITEGLLARAEVHAECADDPAIAKKAKTTAARQINAALEELQNAVSPIEKDKWDSTYRTTTLEIRL